MKQLEKMERKLGELEKKERGLVSRKNGKPPAKAYEEAKAVWAKRKELALQGAAAKEELVSMLAAGKLNGKAEQGWALLNRIDWFVRRQEPMYESIH